MRHLNKNIYLSVCAVSFRRLSPLNVGPPTALRLPGLLLNHCDLDLWRCFSHLWFLYSSAAGRLFRTMAPRTSAQLAMGKPDLAEIEKAGKTFDDDDLIAPTAEEKAAYVRKLDLHMMPVIFLIYMLSVLVRSMHRTQYLDIHCPRQAPDIRLRTAGPVESRQRPPSRP